METLAIWDVNKQATLSREANLRNVCRQIEDEYVTWGRRVTVITQVQWPAIGELGRYTVKGVVVRFIKHRRSVDVKGIGTEIIGSAPVRPGMASDLYALAGTIADRGQLSADSPTLAGK